MSDARLSIIVDADVAKAVSGVNLLQTQLERLQKIASLPNLNFRQQERLNSLLQKTQGEIAKFNRAADISTGLNKFSGATNSASQSILNFGRVLQDAPFGILGIANNFNPLLESFQRASAAAKETGTSLTKNLVGALMGPAGVGLAVSAVSSLLIVFGDKLFGAGKSLSNAEIEASKFAASLNDIKVGIDDFFSRLDFETNLQKLTNKLKLGDKAELFNIGLDKKTADDIVKDTQDQISKASFRIAELINNSTFLLSKDGKKLANAFFSSLQTGTVIPSDLIDKLNDSDKKVFDILNEQAIRINSLTSQNTKARRKSAEADVQAEIQKQTELKKLLETQKSDFEKFVNDTIAKGRQFAKEFGDVIVVPDLEESFFHGKFDVFKDAKKLLNDVNTGDLKIKIPVQIITDADFITEPSIKLSEELRNAYLDEMAKARQEPFVFDPTLQIAVNNEKAKLEAEKRAEQLAESIRGIFADAFQSFGDDIGKAFTGGGDLFGSLFAIIGSGVQTLGKQIIALGVAALKVKAALKGLLANPGLAIAAGIALTAIGAAMKNITGIKGFAEGGLVFGPTIGLIGEGPGTNRSNPEVIAPLDKLKKFMGKTGGEMQVVIVNRRVRGRDIVLQTNREQRSQQRRT